MILNVDRRKSECCWLGGATADSGTAEARLLLLLQCHSAGDSEAGPRVGTELQVSVSDLQEASLHPSSFVKSYPQ